MSRIPALLWRGALSSALLAALEGASSIPAASKRPFTVSDSIEIAYFDDLSEHYPDPRASLDGGLSPDGRHYAAVTHRGVLPEGVTESTIWVFDTAAVRAFVNGPRESAPPSPLRLARLSAAVNGLATSIYDANPITHVRWTSNSRSIAFLGNKMENRRLFVADLERRRIAPLTPVDQDIGDFGENGGTIAYLVRPAADDAKTYISTGPGIANVEIATGKSLFELLYPNWFHNQWRDGPAALWKARGGQTSAVEEPAGSSPVSLLDSDVLSVSPKGDLAVATAYAKRVPKDWEQYETGLEFPGSRFVADPEAEPEPELGKRRAADFLRPKQYVVVDLRSGKFRPILESPIGGGVRGYLDEIIAAWSPDGSRVALSNAYLPLSPAAGSGGASKRPCVVVVDLASGNAECVKESDPVRYATYRGQTHLIRVVWARSGQQLFLQYGGRYERQPPFSVPPEVFRSGGSGWQKVPGASEEGAASVSFTVREALNDPPVLVATDSATGRSRVVLDPNPQIAGIELGEASVYRWRDKLGRDLTGALVKPADYRPGRRYPLVIQTHGFNPKRFLKNGGVGSDQAARALAARGMLVLQVDEPPGRFSTDTTIPPADLIGVIPYLAALDKLAAEGLIDPKKVGIEGNSYTGHMVWASLIRASDRFAAAALSEADIGSMWSYIENLDYASPSRLDDYASWVGGAKPFGEGLKKWLELSPGFHTEKVRAPVLYQQADPVTLIYGWDGYAMLRLQGKPVELLYFRDGRHPLLKPLQRLVCGEMHVDWFDFWLNGREDPDPKKAEQYARWRKLRKLHEANLRSSS